MTLEEFASRIAKAKPSNSPKFGRMFKGSCPCPGHGKGRGDKTQSFAVWEGQDGWLHVKCQAGCAEDDILSSMGLTQEDRRIEPRNPGKVSNGSRKHIYTNVQGVYRFTKEVTRDNPGGPKDVRQYITLPQGGVERSLSSLGDESKTLYRIGEVARAVSNGGTIYLHEGENAADIMAEYGFVATCQPSGAGPGKWLPMHTEFLTGATEVVIVADLDKVGEEYAREVAALLKRRVGRVSVVQSATGKAHDDAYDHFKSGFSVSDFINRPDLALAAPLEIETITEEAIDNYSVEFLWEPYLRRGKCVLLDADGGTGKTSIAIAMAASLTNGKVPWDGSPNGKAARVLYLHKGEDDSLEIMTVFRANGGCMEHFLIPKVAEGSAFNAQFLERLEATIQGQRIDLVVVDALFYFIGPVVKDIYKSTDCLPVMESLNGIASRTGCTFLNIRHTTKGQTDKQASEIGMGSVQFRNSHRGQLVMRWHPEIAGVVVLTDEKGSLLVPRGVPMAFKRRGMEIDLVDVDLGSYEMKADLDSAGKAEEWLATYMAHAVTARVADILTDAAKTRGYNKSTIYRAARALGYVKDGEKRTTWSAQPAQQFPVPETDTINLVFDPFAD